MDKDKYNYLQSRLRKKIIQYPTNKQEKYNEGIRSAMSIVKEICKEDKDGK